MTQKPPMTESRKENTHNAHLPSIEKRKLASPFQKKKILGLSVHSASPHWLSKILILKFVGHHFCSHSHAGGTMKWGA
jgi:hypothetical protein